VIVIIAAIAGGGDESHEAKTNPDTQTQGQQQEPNQAQGQEQKPEEDNVPREYKNALKKAESYSNTMHMSKMGIYDQLVSEYGENFPAEAAQYAVDNLQADYKENALKKAKSYYESMNMSKSAVREQLISEYGEKFTAEEADYAIEHLE